MLIDDDEREAIARSRHDLTAFAPLYDHYHDAIYGYSLAGSVTRTRRPTRPARRSCAP